MGLFGLFKKKKRKKAIISPKEPLNRLTPDGKLPWGWRYENKAFVDRLTKEYKHFLNAWLDSRKKSDLEEYAALKSFVIYMNDVKKLCKRKGECFNYWRDDLFDDKYLERQTDRLKKLERKLKK